MIPRTGKKAVLLKAFTEILPRFQVLMVKTIIQLYWLVVNLYQTRQELQPMIFFSHQQVPGQLLLPMEQLNTAVFDATVYRLREVVLAYSLPSTILNKLKLTAVTFSVSGRNLWFLAPNVPKYTHIDPDFNSVVNANTQGIEGGGAPSTRRVGVNLNITF